MQYIIENGILRRIIPGKGEKIAYVPETVTELLDGNVEFEESKKIKRIVFSNGLQTITGRAFRGFTGLESVVLPASLNAIWYENGYGPFYSADCPSLRYVQFMGKPEKEWIDGIPTAFAYLEEGPDVFTPKYRNAAISGFIEAVTDGVPMEDNVLTAYNAYIKKHAVRYAESAHDNPLAYRYLIANKMIKKKDIDGLIEKVKWWKDMNKMAKSDLPSGQKYKRLVKKNDEIINQLIAYKEQC